MYTVTMEKECSCFKKSDYKAEESFEYQKDAYNYANTIIEFMNEDFCKTHSFIGQRTLEDNFVIQVVANADAGSCSTGSCGPCGC